MRKMRFLSRTRCPGDSRYPVGKGGGRTFSNSSSFFPQGTPNHEKFSFAMSPVCMFHAVLLDFSILYFVNISKFIYFLDFRVKNNSQVSARLTARLTARYQPGISQVNSQVNSQVSAGPPLPLLFLRIIRCEYGPRRAGFNVIRDILIDGSDLRPLRGRRLLFRSLRGYRPYGLNPRPTALIPCILKDQEHGIEPGAPVTEQSCWGSRLLTPTGPTGFAGLFR